MMVKVTLSNGEHDELVLGPFNQGVLLRPRMTDLRKWSTALVDVATDKTIAFAVAVGEAVSDWRRPGGRNDEYSQLFIQQVPIAEQRMILGAELDVLVMEAPHCEAAGCREHDHCRRIEQVRARLEEIS